MTKLCLLVLWLLAFAVAHAADKPPVKPEPTISIEQKLKIRDAQILSLKATAEFDTFVKSVQADDTFKRLQKATQAANSVYEAAVKEAVAASGCADCNLDIEKLTLSKPKPQAAKNEAK